MRRIITSITLGAMLLVPSIADAGRGATWASLNNAISSGNQSAILSEIERAEKLPCASCIDLITPLIDDERWAVRDVAAWWLSKRAVRVQVREDMHERLLSGDSVRARNAAQVLGRFMHPGALAALEVAVHDGQLDDDARVAAVDAIGMIGHIAGKDILEAALMSESEEVRAAAADTLRSIRGNVEGINIVPLLDDESPEVIRAAALSLGAIEETAAVADLIEVAQDGDLPDQVRKDATWALGQIGDGSAAGALKAISEDDSSMIVRGSARTAWHKLRS
jgi:HEAT repeat protein